MIATALTALRLADRYACTRFAKSQGLLVDRATNASFVQGYYWCDPSYAAAHNSHVERLWSRFGHID
jgi:hypothetical protein